MITTDPEDERLLPLPRLLRLLRRVPLLRLRSENDYFPYFLDVDYFLHAPKTPALPEDLLSTRVHPNPTPISICPIFYNMSSIL